MPPYKPRKHVTEKLDNRTKELVALKRIEETQIPAHREAAQRASDILKLPEHKRPHLAPKTSWLRNDQLSTPDETVEYALMATYHGGRSGTVSYTLSARVTRPNPVDPGATLVEQDDFAYLNTDVTFIEDDVSVEGRGVTMVAAGTERYCPALDASSPDFAMIIDTLKFLSQASKAENQAGAAATAQVVS